MFASSLKYNTNLVLLISSVATGKLSKCQDTHKYRVIAILKSCCQKLIHTLQKCDFSKNTLGSAHHFCATHKKKKDAFGWAVILKSLWQSDMLPYLSSGRNNFIRYCRRKYSATLCKGFSI